jgi:biopolymer transport protein ExbB
MDKIIHFFAGGGVFMVPLVICSIVSVAIIIERGIALGRKRVIKASLAEAIQNLHAGQDITLIEQLSADESTALSRLIRSCIRNMPWSKYENTETLQTKARYEISQLERGLVFLEIVVGIGPLLGLLGAVSGMVTIFAGAGAAGLASQGNVIASGISEALSTTVVGLVVAIPSLIAHSLYTRRVEGFAIEMENLCVEFIGKIYSERDSD